MKFWKKLVLFVITIISIILSFSRYYIVKSNFYHSIDNSSKQYMNQQLIERYMLENEIIKTIQMGEEVTDEKIVETLKSLYNYMGDNKELVALYGEDNQEIYSNMSQIEGLDIKSILNEEIEKYSLKKFGDNHYMFFVSYWTSNNKTIYIVNAYDVQKIYIEKDRQMREMLITDIIILSISTIVISVVSIYLTNPIKNLNKASKKIASGKFNEKVKIKSKDEIGELAKSFNIMAEQIENRINQLNLLNKQKDDFINGFTHELKTPMTSIVGYAGMLRLKKCDEEVYRKSINYIYQEAKRLESLSFKLMRLMSLTNGKIEMTNINIVEFINKIANSEGNIVKNNVLELDIEESIIKGDKELLEVVIRNLVENANKAEPKDNKIIIKGEKIKNNKYRIYVIDKGRGIPKEHIDRVIEDFYMVDKSRSRTNGGSGIGLSLVKKILLAHNSNINIQSKENLGTVVYFDLEEVEL
jgi:signal transduction histidine kinase